MRQNNKGFTLVELIVVVAILAILMTVFGLSMQAVSNTKARKAANAISDMMAQCKILTLSGENSPCLEIYVYDNAYWADLTVRSADGTALERREHKKLGSVSLTITYDTNAPATDQAVPLYLAYDRETGACLTLKEAAANVGETVDQEVNCTRIKIDEYSIVLTPLTGHHTLV